MHVTNNNTVTRGSRNHGTTGSGGTGGHRNRRRVSLRPRAEARGHAAGADHVSCCRAHPSATHAHRGNTAEAVSRKADRGAPADSVGSTRYGMLDHGWDRLVRLLSICGYVGAAPVSLRDYSHMMRLAVDSVTPGIDGDRARGVSRSDSAGVAACRHWVASSIHDALCF